MGRVVAQSVIAFSAPAAALGTALIERDGLDCPTWDNRGTVSREVRERERLLDPTFLDTLAELIKQVEKRD